MDSNSDERGKSSKKGSSKEEPVKKGSSKEEPKGSSTEESKGSSTEEPKGAPKKGSAKKGSSKKPESPEKASGETDTQSEQSKKRARKYRNKLQDIEIHFVVRVESAEGTETKTPRKRALPERKEGERKSERTPKQSAIFKPTEQDDVGATVPDGKGRISSWWRE